MSRRFMNSSAINNLGMKRHVVIIDQGTHSSRAIVFGNKGNVLAISTAPIKTVYPKPGFVEQSPADILSSIYTVLEQLASMLSPEQARYIDAAALIVQRSSFLACDKSLKPLTPVISWQDTRNQVMIDQLRQYRQSIRAETGLRMNAHYGASKMRWLLDNDSVVSQASKSDNLLFVPLAAFIACKLAGSAQCVVDPVIASRTLLMMQDNCEWSSAMSGLFGIDQRYLPGIVPSDHYYGDIHCAGKPVPLHLTGGDQSFMAFADGIPLQPDIAYVNAGTGAFIQMLEKESTGDPDLLCSPLIVTCDGRISVTEGTVHAAATALDWLWNRAGAKPEYAAIELAMQSAHNPPLFINTLTGTGSPYWLDARPPVFVGDASLTEQAIAIIESIVFGLMDNLQHMQAKNASLANILAGGGISRSNGFCQKLANLSGLTVARMTFHEMSARGAALYLLELQQAAEDTVKEYFYPLPDKALQQRYEKYTGYIIELSVLSRD